jgi:hypothetical protein
VKPINSKILKQKPLLLELFPKLVATTLALVEVGKNIKVATGKTKSKSVESA